MPFTFQMPEPASLAYVLTSLLALLAVATAYLAGATRRRREEREVDLDALHRHIDELRDRIKAGDGAFDQRQELAALLEGLRRSLPEGDLRR